MNEYITYGFDNFNRELLKNNLNGINLNDNENDKPLNAWWGSPLNAEKGWSDCDAASCCGFHGHYHTPYIKWKLNNAKIYNMQTFKDLANIPFYIERNKYKIDFDKLKELGYDGMELKFDRCPLGSKNITKEELDIAYAINFSNLYGWDCESICIWNANVIDIIEEKNNYFNYNKEDAKQEIELFFKKYLNRIIIKEEDISEDYSVDLDCYYKVANYITIKFDNIYDIYLDIYYPENNLEKLYNSIANGDICKMFADKYSYNYYWYSDFKGIEEDINKTEFYLYMKDEMIEKAKYYAKNLSEESKKEIFEEKLPEEFVRILYPVKFNKEDYYETLAKHGILININEESINIVNPIKIIENKAER